MEARIKIGIEFVVESIEALTENQVQSAASRAAFHYLALVEESTQGAVVDVVTVHVAGHGEVDVSLGSDHD